jgi:hypothetical protein
MRYSFRERKWRCDPCEWEGKLWHWSNEPAPECPSCSVALEPNDDPEPNRAAAVVPDDIPGGLLVKHAICNDDGSPKRYYSKTEIKAAAAAKGWTINGDTPKDAGSRWV